jgi:hypothetical protein
MINEKKSSIHSEIIVDSQLISLLVRFVFLRDVSSVFHLLEQDDSFRLMFAYVHVIVFVNVHSIQPEVYRRSRIDVYYAHRSLSRVVVPRIISSLLNNSRKISMISVFDIRASIPFLDRHIRSAIDVFYHLHLDCSHSSVMMNH